MLIEWFLSIKSLPNLLFGVLCLPGDQSHLSAQPTINPLACCICWAGLLGLTVFPPWNKGLNFGSYIVSSPAKLRHTVIALRCQLCKWSYFLSSIPPHIPSEYHHIEKNNLPGDPCLNSWPPKKHEIKLNSFSLTW